MKTHVMLLLIFACLSGYCQTKDKKNENYSSVSLSKDDTVFLALKDSAQLHLQTFIDSLNVHGKDTANYRFGVKSDFVENDNHEHMWSLMYTYDNRSFTGVFIDSAFIIRNIKTWDKVTIDRNSIEDWSIYSRITKKTIGNYSEAYLKSKEREN